MQTEEFQKRRENFLSMIGQNTIAIIPNHHLQVRNSDVYFPFRSNSDFYYLTGFNQPDAVAVFISCENPQYILFCQEKNRKKEIWEGEIIGLDNAVALYGADNAYPITDIEDIMPNLLEKKSRLIYNMGVHDLLDQNIPIWIKKIEDQACFGVFSPKEITSPDGLLHEMRLFKSKSEVAQLKKATKVTTKAHLRAMKTCKPGMMEYQLEAQLLFEFNLAGSNMPAYPSIVAGGVNACTLHYTKNDQPLNDGDLVLIDAGSEHQCYAADVTRTFPVNGKFSQAQKEIYQIVLDAQLAAIEQAKPGMHWNDIHDTAVRVVADGLLQLGIFSGKLEDVIITEQYKQYFMHRTGHWLGMDVHDAGDYKVSGNRWRMLEPGMVLTIEPGIYIAPKSLAPKKYHGIGVRIEDDILITKNGCDVLTQKIPKTIDEIEATMRQSIIN